MSRVEGMSHEERVAFVVEAIGNAIDLEEDEAAALRTVLDNEHSTFCDRESAAWVIAAALEDAR